ncbi:hypothetical protein [Pseudomonas frederiksbergensis]
MYFAFVAILTTCYGELVPNWASRGDRDLAGL